MFTNVKSLMMVGGRWQVVAITKTLPALATSISKIKTYHYHIYKKILRFLSHISFVICTYIIQQNYLSNKVKDFKLPTSLGPTLYKFETCSNQ